MGTKSRLIENSSYKVKSPKMWHIHIPVPKEGHPRSPNLAILFYRLLWVKVLPNIFLLSNHVKYDKPRAMKVLSPPCRRNII